MTRLFARSNTLINIILATIIGFNISCSSNKNADTEINNISKVVVLRNYEIREPAKKILGPWKGIDEYNNFIDSVVKENYERDVKEIYSHYKIKRDIPRYEVNVQNDSTSYFYCDGAIYRPKKDIIYFYAAETKKLFEKYANYHKIGAKDIKEELIKDIHYYIKHEASHAFYYDLAKKIVGESIFREEKKDTTTFQYANNLEYMRFNLVEEGIADYMAYKGELTELAKTLTDNDFQIFIKDGYNNTMYGLGAILVKPILDKDFNKGITALMKNRLTTKNLYNLPAYRSKILRIMDQ